VGSLIERSDGIKNATAASSPATATESLNNSAAFLAIAAIRSFNTRVDEDAPVTVSIDLAKIRAQARQIREKTGVDLLAVVKADAYGLGAKEVAEAIGDVVDGFCVFSLREAEDIRLWETAKKPILALGPPTGNDADRYLAAHVRPAVSTIESAKTFRAARPILNVDTGMQRFACPIQFVDEALAAGQCEEAFTHAIRVEQVNLLRQACGNRGLSLHASGSALLAEPTAWLDAVRPGIAIYRGCARISTPLIETKESGRPAGYSGFVTPRFGVIHCGYSRGLRRGPCAVNGATRNILEVGMQTAFVEIGANDHVGDELVLLGDAITEKAVATAWGTSEQEVLVNLARSGRRVYR
jgi:alanine racemase